MRLSQFEYTGDLQCLALEQIRGSDFNGGGDLYSPSRREFTLISWPWLLAGRKLNCRAGPQGQATSKASLELTF